MALGDFKHAPKVDPPSAEALAGWASAVDPISTYSLFRSTVGEHSNAALLLGGGLVSLRHGHAAVGGLMTAPRRCHLAARGHLVERQDEGSG